MAAKWADFLISAVEYNSEETHIVRVRTHADNGDTVGQAVDVSRMDVVVRLAASKTFCTIVEGSDGKWQCGAPVRVVTINNQQYIRTDADGTARDNLGNLPRL